MEKTETNKKKEKFLMVAAILLLFALLAVFGYFSSKQPPKPTSDFSLNGKTIYCFEVCNVSQYVELIEWGTKNGYSIVEGVTPTKVFYTKENSSTTFETECTSFEEFYDLFKEEVHSKSIKLKECSIPKYLLLEK